MTQELTIYSTGSLLVQAQKRLHLQPEWHLRPAFTHLQSVHLPVLPQPQLIIPGPPVTVLSWMRCVWGLARASIRIATVLDATGLSPAGAWYQSNLQSIRVGHSGDSRAELRWLNSFS